MSLQTPPSPHGTEQIEAARPRVILVQDGARLRYALPRALKAAGVLETMHTDWFIRPGTLDPALAGLLRRLPYSVGRRLANRRSPELRGSRVITAGWSALWARLCERADALPEELWRHRSRAMARQVLADGWRDANALAGFIRNIDPLICEAARGCGMTVVLDQMIAPMDIEAAAAAEQQALWPGWESQTTPAGGASMREVEQRSWAAATAISCASDYVRDGLVRCGVPPQRIAVVPYPIDTHLFTYLDRRRREGPVRVGFVGALSLRKGAPAFLTLARHFGPEAASFTMVGPSVLDPGILERERGRVQLTGNILASSVPEWLAGFDLFVFPSTCEGSAGAVMEAMATGLPVVTTPQSGSLVRDGIEGYVHESYDLDGMTASIDRLIRDPELRYCMGRAARLRGEAVTIDQYGKAWRALLENGLSRQGVPA
jgi:hypothetical protein